MDIPKLSGLPGDQDLHQMVAVSDAVDHPPHDFSAALGRRGRAPGDPGQDADRGARLLLTAYEAANAVAPAAPPPAPAPHNRRQQDASHHRQSDAATAAA